MKTYDLIIIGGGVIGASIARELSRYRLSIALLEKEDELAFGVSKSNSGIIHSGTQNHPGSLKGRLCVRGNAMTRRVCRELGVDFKEIGQLIVAFSAEEASRLVALKGEADALGVPGTRIVDRSWLRRHEPNLTAEVIAALYAPTAGIVSPYRLVYALAENAAKNAVDIFKRSQVKKIVKNGGFFEVTAAAQVFRTRYLVNAAGLFADDVARLAGIVDFTILPRKGEEFLLDKKREGLARHLIFPLPSKTSKGILIIRTADGNPMIGPTADEAADKKDLATSESGFARVLAAARRLLPSINENDVIAYFAGLRPVAGDDFIIRHEDAVPGLVTVAGIQSPGLTAAPAVALMVRDILRSSGLALRKKLIFRGQRPRSIHLFSVPLRKTRALIQRDAAYGDIVCRCEMVSAKEVREAIGRGARTMDGIKFRTRAQAGRCHGSFCTTRIMKILAEETGIPVTAITKRGGDSQIVAGGR